MIKRNKKIKLVPNAKSFWRLWSVRLSAIGASIMGYFTLYPDKLLEIWLIMPPDLKALLPSQYVSSIAMFIFIGASIARVIKQEKVPQKKEEEPDDQTERSD